MKSLNGYEPWVIRTDFSSDGIWKKVRDLITAPQKLFSDSEDKAYAYVTCIDDAKFREKSAQDVVHSLPDDYDFFFCFVVDVECIQNSEHSVLVVGFYTQFADDKDPLDSWVPRKPAERQAEEIVSFRALPSQVQSIENNLSISNMGFEDFANAVDHDGVFRGFRRNRR